MSEVFELRRDSTCGRATVGKDAPASKRFANFGSKSPGITHVMQG
jgi:hypothetical protein